MRHLKAQARSGDEIIKKFSLFASLGYHHFIAFSAKQNSVIVNAFHSILTIKLILQSRPTIEINM